MVLLDNIYDWVLIVSCTLGFIYFLINRPFTYLHTLPFFILYIYSIEYYGGYLSNIGKYNLWLYNYSSVVEFVFYMWVVGKMYLQKKTTATINIIAIIYTIVALVNIIFFQGKTGFHTLTFGLGSLLLISSCIYYFYQLLLFPEKDSLLQKIEFWICTAILFSFTCSFPIFCLNNIYYHKVAMAIWPIIFNISNIINIIFYSLFAVAFLCQIKIKKYLPL